MQMSPIMQMLMSKLQSKNPQGYQAVSQAMRSNGNPQAMLKQLLGNATPEQKQGLLNQAKSYGVPDNILSQLQNMK